MGYSYDEQAIIEEFENKDFFALIQTPASKQSLSIPISTQNVWVKSSGSYTKLADSRGWFNLTDANTGEVTYVGSKTITALIATHVTCQIGSGQDAQIDVKINGASASALQSPFYCANPVAFTAHDFVTLEPNDVIQLYLRNTEGISNITFDHHSFTIKGV